MKILLDLKDAKAEFVMELLNSFSFVRAKTLTPYKINVLEGMKESILMGANFSQSRCTLSFRARLR